MVKECAFGAYDGMESALTLKIYAHPLSMSIQKYKSCFSKKIHMKETVPRSGYICTGKSRKNFEDCYPTTSICIG